MVVLVLHVTCIQDSFTALVQHVNLVSCFFGLESQ